jgi:hypothetical protein
MEHNRIKMEMAFHPKFKLTAMNMKKEEITFKKYINFISLYTKNLLHMSLQREKNSICRYVSSKHHNREIHFILLACSFSTGREKVDKVFLYLFFNAQVLSYTFLLGFVYRLGFFHFFCSSFLPT